MPSFVRRYADHFLQFRSEIKPTNYGTLVGAILAACVGFLLGQALFNRTLITWIAAGAPSTDPAYLNSHHGVVLRWAALSLVCLLVDLSYRCGLHFKLSD
jgi:hypothetical protein